MTTAAILEAILFVAEVPVPAEELAQVLELGIVEVTSQLEALALSLQDQQRGLVLRNVGGGWRLFTKPDLHPYLERFATSPTATRLSGPARESLAVVAYRQPVSRAQVAEIRGVDSEQTLATLERLGLIEEVGRAPGVGSPILYGTTSLFLEQLGMAELSELPPLADHVPGAEVMEALERPFRPEPPSSESRS